MRILLILDIKSKGKEAIINDAWNKFLADYSDTTLKIERTDVWIDLSKVPWVEYPYMNIKNLYGFDLNWVRNYCNSLWKRENGKYDLIIFAVDETNWKEPNGSWGWNLGQWFNDYQVQMVRVSPYLDLGFRMEIAHSLDQFINRELGINLSRHLNIPDWDEDIIHGRITDPTSPYIYYKGWFGKIGGLLTETFDKRVNKWRQVLILKKLLELYTKLINLLQKKSNTPLLREEVEDLIKNKK